MQRRKIVPQTILGLAFISAASLAGQAQQLAARNPLNLVMPSGSGRIIVPAQQDLQSKTISLYDNGTRPVVQMASKYTGISISYTIFPNSSGSSSPQQCLDPALNAAIQSTAPRPDLYHIKQIKKSDHAPINGTPVAMASFFVDSLLNITVEQETILAVAASPTACASIYITKPTYKPKDEPGMIALLDSFVFEPDYVPSPQDYFTLGTIFYNILKSYAPAAVYYQRALDTLTPQAPPNIRRILIDQLSMSYGLTGQIKKSRAINEAAIKADPDYPLYYYNLACADGEEGNAKDAQLRLQQAFDRKANTIPGERLPDPTQDNSILKLKDNEEFWAFVLTLK